MNIRQRVSVHAYYTVKVKEKSGEVRSYHCPNVITQGKITYPAMLVPTTRRILIGSGSGTPAYTDTQLWAQFASLTATMTSSSTVTPYTYTFVMEIDEISGEEYVGTVFSELGAVANGSTLISHALIVDSQGNPSPFTKSDTQTVSISYTCTSSYAPGIVATAGDHSIYLTPHEDMALSGSISIVCDNNSTVSISAVVSKDLPNKQCTLASSGSGLIPSGRYSRLLRTNYFKALPYDAVKTAVVPKSTDINLPAVDSGVVEALSYTTTLQTISQISAYQSVSTYNYNNETTYLCLYNNGLCYLLSSTDDITFSILGSYSLTCNGINVYADSSNIYIFYLTTGGVLNRLSISKSDLSTVTTTIYTLPNTSTNLEFEIVGSTLVLAYTTTANLLTLVSSSDVFSTVTVASGLGSSTRPKLKAFKGELYIAQDSYVYKSTDFQTLTLMYTAPNTIGGIGASNVRIHILRTANSGTFMHYSEDGSNWIVGVGLALGATALQCKSVADTDGNVFFFTTNPGASQSAAVYMLVARYDSPEVLVECNTGSTFYVGRGNVWNTPIYFKSGYVYVIGFATTTTSQLRVDKYKMQQYSYPFIPLTTQSVNSGLAYALTSAFTIDNYNIFETLLGNYSVTYIGASTTQQDIEISDDCLSWTLVQAGGIINKKYIRRASTSTMTIYIGDVDLHNAMLKLNLINLISGYYVGLLSNTTQSASVTSVTATMTYATD